MIKVSGVMNQRIKMVKALVECSDKLANGVLQRHVDLHQLYLRAFRCTSYLVQCLNAPFFRAACQNNRGSKLCQLNSGSFSNPRVSTGYDDDLVLQIVLHAFLQNLTSMTPQRFSNGADHKFKPEHTVLQNVLE